MVASTEQRWRRSGASWTTREIRTAAARRVSRRSASSEDVAPLEADVYRTDPATICQAVHDAHVAVVHRRSGRRRRPGRRAHAGGRRRRLDEADAHASTARRTRAAAGRARRRWPRSTRRPASSSPAGARRSTARLRALHGHPVVVNKWASWCVPCRTEIPLFQRAVRRHGTKVAFLGVNAGDYDGPPRSSSRLAAALPVLRGPRREDRGRSGARGLPDHRVLRPPRQARVHPPGRLPRRGGARRRHRAVPPPDRRSAERTRRRELAAALDAARRVFCGEQGVTSSGDRDGRDGEALQLVAVDDGAVVGDLPPADRRRTVQLGRLVRRRAARAPRASRRRCSRAAEGEARAARRRAASCCTRRPPRAALYERAGYSRVGRALRRGGHRARRRWRSELG